MRDTTQPVFVVHEPASTGGGRPLLYAARRLGYRPVIACARPDRFPWIEAESAEKLITDTTDTAKVISSYRQLAERHRVVGMFCPLDALVEQAAIVARTLGLPGPDPAVVGLARSKARQRQALADAGVDSVRYAVVQTESAAVEAAGRIGFPVVAKPTGSTGSQGAALCADEMSVRRQFDRIWKTDWNRSVWNREVLIEQAIPGPMFAIGTFDGRFVYACSERFGTFPNLVVTRHDYPADIGASDMSELAAFAEAVVRTLQLTWGPIDMEVKYSPDDKRFHLIEVNPRIMGGKLCDLIWHATGIDLASGTIERCLGLTPDMKPSRARAASARYILRGEYNASAHQVVLPGDLFPNVVAAEYPADSQGESSGDYRDRIGWVIAVTDHQPAALDEAERAVAFLSAGRTV